jgi:hypothetical protein
MPDGSYCTLQQWIWAISMGFFLSFGFSRNRCIQNPPLLTYHTHTYIHTKISLSNSFWCKQNGHVNPIFSFTSLLTQSKIVGNLVQYSLGWIFDTWAFLKLFWCKTKIWIYSFCVCWIPFLLPAASCVEYANAEDVLVLMFDAQFDDQDRRERCRLAFLVHICSSVPVETVETLCDCGGLWCADWWWMKT